MASYQLFKPEQILFFFAKVSIDVIKVVFVDILKHFVRPCDLMCKIKRSNLLQGPMLRGDQYKLCCIADYNKFDITLLYILIRHLCPIPEPTQRWGHEPSPMNINIGDDIERLRCFRNYFLRVDVTEISDKELRTILSNLKHVMERIYTFTREWSRYNYVEELSKNDVFRYGREDRDMCKYFLRFTFRLRKQLELETSSLQATIRFSVVDASYLWRITKYL